MNPSLSELQKWMRWIFIHPSGPYRALDTASPSAELLNPATLFAHDSEFPFHDSRVLPGRFVEPSTRHLDMLEEQPPIDRLQRLSIYADAYFVRLLESLGSDFRTVREILGTTSFQQLIADYLMRYPSHSTHIGDLGRALPRFISTHELSKKYPYLSDLARLEWNVLRSLYANRLPEMDVVRLADVADQDWPLAQLQLDPTVQLLGTEWAVDGVWRGEKKRAYRKSTWLVIYRDEQWVQLRSIDGPQWFALERFQEGATLERVCHDLAELFPLESESMPIMEWFASWVQLGILKGVQL